MMEMIGSYFYFLARWDKAVLLMIATVLQASSK